MSAYFADPNSAVLPEQLTIIQRVFDDIVGETWFDDTPQNREDLAGLVLHTFQGGKIEEFALLEACHEQAQARFRRT